jgi:hypothetical protein
VSCLRSNCALGAPFDFTTCSGNIHGEQRKTTDSQPVRAEPFGKLRTASVEARIQPTAYPPEFAYVPSVRSEPIVARGCSLPPFMLVSAEMQGENCEERNGPSRQSMYRVS